jgi:hypothetical protein
MCEWFSLAFGTFQKRGPSLMRDRGAQASLLSVSRFGHIKGIRKANRGDLSESDRPFTLGVFIVLISPIYVSRVRGDTGRKEAKDSKHGVYTTTDAQGKAITFANRDAMERRLADMLREQARLIAQDKEKQTLVRKIGQARLNPITLLPIATPRASTGSKWKKRPYVEKTVF